MSIRRPFHNIKEDSDEADIDLTPMLDVVFILLIFFIVTASFVKQTGIEVNKPEAETAATQERGNILIAISDTNQIWMDKRLIDPRALQANIERLIAENPKSTIIIQADSKSTNEKLVKVMDAAHQAGVFNIALAAESP